MSALKYAIPTRERIREEALKRLNLRPCNFQVDSALAQLERREDVFTIAPTGSGKTLCFWLPLLFMEDGIMILVTALNQLGEKMAEEASELGFPAVNLTGRTATAENLRKVANKEFRVVVTNPEVLNDAGFFGQLWKSKSFTSHIFNITLDEGHCLVEWGLAFRQDYKDMHALKWLIPETIRFHIASATMTQSLIRDTRSLLQISAKDVKIIRCSNDRPNIHLVVEEMKFTAKSLQDIDKYLRLQDASLAVPPPKFMVFGGSRDEVRRIGQHLRQQLHPDLRSNVVWFHAGMSDTFRRVTIEKLKSGEVWGIVCTDAAGMGLDIRDIRIIIQWKYTKSLCTLTQRIGRAARGFDTEATAIYIVESKYIDGTKENLKEKEKEKDKSKGKVKEVKTRGKENVAKRKRIYSVAEVRFSPVQR